MEESSTLVESFEAAYDQILSSNLAYDGAQDTLMYKLDELISVHFPDVTAQLEDTLMQLSGITGDFYLKTVALDLLNSLSVTISNTSDLAIAAQDVSIIMTTSISLHHSLSLLFFLSFILYLSLSLSPPLSLSHSLSLSLSHTHTHFLSHSLAFSLSLCISLAVYSDSTEGSIAFATSETEPGSAGGWAAIYNPFIPCTISSFCPSESPGQYS